MPYVGIQRTSHDSDEWQVVDANDDRFVFGFNLTEVQALDLAISINGNCRIKVLEPQPRKKRSKPKMSAVRRIKGKIWGKEPKCFYCRKPLPLKEATLDHVVPVSKGGRTTIGNSVIACVKCNLEKGNKDVSDFLPTTEPVMQQRDAAHGQDCG